MQNKFMELAIEEARLALEEDEVPVGAVIVKDGQVIASAHNMCEQKKNATLHAEVLAINNAMKKLNSSRLNGCEMYVTLEPCAMCCGAISHARISRLYFGAYDKLLGCVVSNMNLLDESSPLNSVEYYCGIAEDECSFILKDFFKNKR